MKLSASDLHVTLGGTPILRGVGFDVSPRTVTALIGPNGAGKSTLLRALAGLIPYRGSVMLDGDDARNLDARAISQRVAYLPQDLQARSRLTLLEVVLLGRLGSLGWHVPPGEWDRARASLDDVGIGHLAGRGITDVSLGQRQLAFVAQALVRKPGLLLLDEPTSALDLRHQLEILELVRSVVREREAAAILALHDLSLAARFADRLVLLAHGRVYAAGEPVDVLTPGIVRDTYAVVVRVDRLDGMVLVTPLAPTSRGPVPDAPAPQDGFGPS